MHRRENHKTESPRRTPPESHAGSLSPSDYPRLSFDDDDWKWFEEACDDLGIPLAPGKRAVAEAIYSHLVGVNGWMNLTRLTSGRDYLKFHLLDSLVAMYHVSELSAPGDIVLDLGSGGGYPGLPMMAWLPDRRYVLVDSRKRKADFLAEAVRLTGCPGAAAYAFRGREVAACHPELRHACQVVTARAVGRGAELLPDATELLRREGVFLLLKGPSYMEQESEEFDLACRDAGFDIEIELPFSLVPGDPERFIVAARKL